MNMSVLKQCSLVYVQVNEQMMFGTAATGMLQTQKKNMIIRIIQTLKWYKSVSYIVHESNINTTLIIQYQLLVSKPSYDIHN